jgi:hypothetical protein
MPAEGMVHALELVHSLLSPGGALIDIHPTGQPYAIEISLGGIRRQLGVLQETDNYIEYFQADEALEKVMQSGLFALTRRENFIFLDHAASLDELRSYLLDNWSDAVWPDEVTRRANEISSPGQSSEIPATLREYVSISRFLRLAAGLDGSPSR